MNNHLIPEQRLDKNGRLNTKHVRAAKPQPSRASVPPPALSGTATAPRKKPLTPGQKKPKEQTLNIAHVPRDHELYRQLGVSPYFDSYRDINASDEEVYAVLSVAAPGNTVALLSAGYRTAEDARTYLQQNGFGHLITDSSEHCAEALERRIPPQRFINAITYLTNPESPHYMDAVEVHSTSKQLSIKVRDGQVNLSDIKEIGLKKIASAKDPETITQALQWIASGDAAMTTADLNELLEEFPYSLRDALKMTNKYGAEFVAGLRYINVDYEDYLERRGTSRPRIKELLAYHDQTSTYELEHQIYREEISYEKLEKYFDAGLDPSHPAEDDCTDQQLDAIKQGVAHGVSGGWL